MELFATLIFLGISALTVAIIVTAFALNVALGIGVLLVVIFLVMVLTASGLF